MAQMVEFYWVIQSKNIAIKIMFNKIPINAKASKTFQDYLGVYPERVFFFPLILGASP